MSILGTKTLFRKLEQLGLTSTIAELNIMDGVTSTAAELNLLDTTVAGTAVASKALALGANKEVDTLVIADSGLFLGSGAGTAVDSTAVEINNLDASAGNPGTVNAPASGTTALSTARMGDIYVSTFTLTTAQIPVTDGAGSGSYGTLKLLDFPEGYIRILGSSQVYTAFAEGAALTGAAGDAVFEIGLGTTAISSAADGVLGATEDNIGTDVNITLSGGTGTGKDGTGTDLVHDGTSTALDLNLNWSGTASTIDANSTIDVTGTIKVIWAFMGDAA